MSSACREKEQIADQLRARAHTHTAFLLLVNKHSTLSFLKCQYYIEVVLNDLNYWTWSLAKPGLVVSGKAEMYPDIYSNVTTWLSNQRWPWKTKSVLGWTDHCISTRLALTLSSNWWKKRVRLKYLGILKHLLQALLHQLEFAGLDATVGQQHAPKQSLRDSAVYWVVPVKLQRGREQDTWQSVMHKDTQITKRREDSQQ